MRNAFEAGGSRDALLDFGGKAVGDLDDFRAGSADQMMMMVVVVGD